MQTKKQAKIKNLFTSSKGAGLVEIVVGVGVFALVMAGLTSTYTLVLKAASSNTRLVKANFLLEEGVEAVRSMRDTSWSDVSSLTPGGDYFLYFDGVSWEATTIPYLVDGTFDQRLTLEEVKRDGDGKISDTGAVDNGTVKATVSVSWQHKGSTSTKSISSYFVNLFE